METVLVQLTNAKALTLLKDLEDLNIIKLISKSVSKKEKISEKYAGKLPTYVAEEFQNYVSESRGEWEKRTI